MISALTEVVKRAVYDAEGPQGVAAIFPEGFDERLMKLLSIGMPLDCLKLVKFIMRSEASHLIILLF